MDVESRAACVERAVYWAQRADNTALNSIPAGVSLGHANLIWPAVTGAATLAQAWAALAQLAPRD